jgi:hypothetical protein
VIGFLYSSQLGKLRMGQKYKVFDIHCGKCSAFVLTYHKYGAGKGILRLYFHRIESPSALAALKQTNFNKVKDVPHLRCPNCEELLGSAVEHKGGKWAFRMRRGYFHRKLKK